MNLKCEFKIGDLVYFNADSSPEYQNDLNIGILIKPIDTDELNYKVYDIERMCLEWWAKNLTSLYEKI